MHDFSCTDPENMNYETLAKKARYFKKDEKGVATISKILEDMKNEAAREAAKEAARKAALENAKEIAERMIRDNEMSLEEIAYYVPALSLDELKRLKAEVMQMA